MTGEASGEALWAPVATGRKIDQPLAPGRLQGEHTDADHFPVSEFVEEWAPRIGEEGARLQVWASRLIALGALAGSVWVAALGAGEATHNEAIQVAGLLLMAIAVSVLAFGTIVRHRSFKAMSRFLGVRVAFLDSPKLHEASFRRWCQQNGVERFSR